MKKCVQCGCDLEDNIIFCPNCGAAQPEQPDGSGNYGNGYYNGAPYGGTYMPETFRTRSIVLCIIFSFISFGFYYLYWIYKLAEGWNDLAEYQGKRPGTSPGLVILFSIITFGIYMMYYWFKMSKIAAEIQDNNGYYLEDNSLVCLLLAIFGLGIVSAAILQNEFNEYIRYNLQTYYN